MEVRKCCEAHFPRRRRLPDRRRAFPALGTEVPAFPETPESVADPTFRGSATSEALLNWGEMSFFGEVKRCGRVGGAGRARRPWSCALILFVAATGAGVTGCTGGLDPNRFRFGSEPGDTEVSAAEEDRRARVTVTGVDGPVADNVLAHLSLATEPCDASRHRLDLLAERAQGEAREGLRALGYYEPGAISVSVSEAGACWEASILVSPGKAVVVDSVDVRLEGEGSEDPEFRAMLEALPLAVGEVLDHGKYESAKRDIEALALRRGFLEGEFVTRRLSVNVGARSAAIELVYAPGRRYRFGTLRIEESRVDRRLIERLAAHTEGAPYDVDEVVALNRRLSQSGYFERVEVRPRLERSVAGLVPLELDLTPVKKHALTARAGVSTDAGPRARLGYENRWVSPRGHRWSASSAASLLGQSLDAEYRLPLASPASDWLSLKAGALREDTDTSQTREAMLGIEQTTRRWGDWLETRFVSVSHDDFTVGRQRGAALLVTPGVRLSTLRSDRQLRPADGYRLSLEVRGAHEAAGSDLSFLRAFGSVGWVEEMAWGGRVLARSELGAVVVDDIETLPPA